ncbi:MAG TPA: membrane dipeptidase [candidate division Zixibacteria bacterium]|nr:membrane dipeptidase [candidate division Zixibacteria bacterium]
MFIVDAHLDLAYNAIRNGRELLKPVADIRTKESREGSELGTAIVSFPELRDAGVGLVFATIFVAPARSSMFKEDEKLVYSTADEAHKQGQLQLDYYHLLWDEVDYLRPVQNASDLEMIVTSHKDGADPLVGMVVLMEGADPIRNPEELEMWHERGLRVVGLAWDDTRYAAGAWREGGGITPEGFQLLEVMADLGMILDLTHMGEEGTLQAIDRYEGAIIASHSNARDLVPGQRQLSDTQIIRLIERDGMIGIVLANPFLKEGHKRGDPKENVTLDHVVAHIDHICQLVGDAQHVGLGTDFDGGFGVEAIPAEISGVSDLPLIAKALGNYGYSDPDIQGIMGDNWLRILRSSLG